MGITGSIIAACIGLINLRFAMHQNSIASQRKLFMATAFVAAFALFFPLLSFGISGGSILIGLTVVLLFPYKQTLIWFLERTARNGVRKLSREVKGKYLYNSASRFFTFTHVEDGHKIWVGNVLNRMGSLEQQVTAESRYYMLAFVLRLEQPPTFNCSLLKGWAAPRFHDEEYRSRTRLLKGSFTICKQDQHSTQERVTQGNCKQLEDHYDPASNHTRHKDPRYKLFSRILSNNREEFETLFSGEAYDTLINCASHSQYYELNITPTSINIYTTLCNYEVQKFNMDLLVMLGQSIKLSQESEDLNLNSELCTQDAVA